MDKKLLPVRVAKSNPHGNFVCPMKGQRCYHKKRNGRCSRSDITMYEGTFECIDISRVPDEKVRDYEFEKFLR